MIEKGISMFIYMLVPAPTRRAGKTGSVSRLIEMLKRFNDFNKELQIIINTSKQEADYLKRVGIVAEYRIVNTSLIFKNNFDLGIKTLYLIVKSLFFLPSPSSKNQKNKIKVYSSSDLFWEVIPAFIYKLKNKKIEWIQVIHHIYPNWKKRQGKRLINYFGYYFQKFSLYLIKEKADKIIILSHLIKEELLKRGFEDEKLYISSNGIDYNYLDNIRKSNDIYDGIYLGRMDYSKGVADLIDIWEKICQKNPNAKLAMIGGIDSEIKKMLMEKIKAKSLEKNIEILGFLENNEAFTILKNSKVFLFPSHEEGWGIAIAEAMACGLPVASWNLPVFREVFENYTIQVKENDINLFSEKVIELLKNDELRKKVGDNGKEFVKKYSWDSVARKEYEIIKK